MKKVAVVYGTRPEAIKVAPVVHALKRESDIDTIVVSTGQHREMLHSVEQIFNLEPDTTLDVMRPGQELTELFSRVAASMDSFLVDARPDIVVVHGDTTTAASAALSAFHREVAVAHLEAGLRSGSIWSPFPEEGNRRLITRMSQVHLAPTVRAEQNLRSEGIASEEITVTGNTVIDALQWAAERADAMAWPADLAHLAGLPASARLLLVTLHRRENQATAIGTVSETLAQFAKLHDDVHIVFPMHRNPVVRAAVRGALGFLPNVDLVDPVDYLTMVKLLRRAWLVVTDSGGIQEEAPAFGVPVLVARDTTERPEAVEAGVARLVGGDGAALRSQLQRFEEDPSAWATMARAVNPFGDGEASARVVSAIRSHLGLPAREAALAR